jgi:hypothetical protein
LPADDNVLVGRVGRAHGLGGGARERGIGGGVGLRAPEEVAPRLVPELDRPQRPDRVAAAPEAPALAVALDDGARVGGVVGRVARRVVLVAAGRPGRGVVEDRQHVEAVLGGPAHQPVGRAPIEAAALGLDLVPEEVLADPGDAGAAQVLEVRAGRAREREVRRVADPALARGSTAREQHDGRGDRRQSDRERRGLQEHGLRLYERTVTP